MRAWISGKRTIFRTHWIIDNNLWFSSVARIGNTISIHRNPMLSIEAVIKHYCNLAFYFFIYLFKIFHIQNVILKLHIKLRPLHLKNITESKGNNIHYTYTYITCIQWIFKNWSDPFETMPTYNQLYIYGI